MRCRHPRWPPKAAPDRYAQVGSSSPKPEPRDSVEFPAAQAIQKGAAVAVIEH